MIKILLRIFAIIFLVFFQLALMPKLTILGVIPNIVILLAIALVFKGRAQDGFLVAGVGGLLLDFVSPIRFGFYTFFFVGVLLAINFYILKIFPTPNLGVSFLIFMASILLIDLGFLGITKNFPAWQLIPQAIIGGFWGIFVYWLIENIIKPQEEIKLT